MKDENKVIDFDEFEKEMKFDEDGFPIMRETVPVKNAENTAFLKLKGDIIKLKEEKQPDDEELFLRMVSGCKKIKKELSIKISIDMIPRGIFNIVDESFPAVSRDKKIELLTKSLIQYDEIRNLLIDRITKIYNIKN